MDIINKSKALNILIPRLIDKSNNLTKEIKSRIKLNKIFSEFENKASNNLNYFITASNQRYTNSKLGNDLDSILYNTREKNMKEAKKIINDKFYQDPILEIEKQKMKYKSSNKIYKEIKDTFNKMKFPLETKFSKNSNKEIQLIIKGIDIKNPPKKIINIEENDESRKNAAFNKDDYLKRNKNTINIEFETEQNSINNSVTKYLNNLNSENVQPKTGSSNSLSPNKKHNFKLPKIKLINYKQYQPPRRVIITEEDKKPNIRKILPYSKLGRNNENNKKSEEIPFNENKNFPFITEPNLNINRITKYNNTLNVVYNSATNEFSLRDKFDMKRRRLEKILGINDIPQLNTYDDIAFKKSERIKENRHKKARELKESQKYAFLSRRAKVNLIIDNDMTLLNKLENKIYNNENIINKTK